MVAIPLYDAADLYDLIHGAFASGPWLDFYIAHTRSDSDVLELACGTGRLTIPLAVAGRRMAGLDTSESMLALARAKAAARKVDVSWTLGDMTLFSLGRSFDTILLPAQSMSHLSHREQIEGLFDSVRRSLKPDGTFILELFCPSIELLAGAETPETAAGEVLEHNGKRLRLTSTLKYDVAEQCSDCEFLLTDVEDGDVARLAFRMRQFFPRELDALVIYNGFEIVQKYGAHDMSSFHSASQRQLLVCQPSPTSR